ncbi:MAG: hypothetical protein RIQ94_309 [Pseudomonadota bacterium]|jgi:hypothetical protein
MNRKRLYLLVSICSACIFIIICEWSYGLWLQKQLLNSTTASHTELSADKMPVIDLLNQPEENYVNLVTRPLFIKGRRPVKEISQETALSAGTMTNTFDWQVNGIYTTPKGVSALFSHSRAKTIKNAHRKLTIGADLDGWKITEIHKDLVLLEKNNQPKELLLQKPKPKELAKNPNTSLVAGFPPETPNIPPPPETPNPFNTPNSPQPALGGFENIDNDNH